jgi:hypothetical protein
VTAPVPAGNSEHISLGPGKLWFARPGVALPTDIGTTLDSAFEPIGYTEEGSELSYELSSEPVEVAESLEPVFYRTVGRSGTVTFAMAENTARNLTIAFNGGRVVKTASGATKYTPPEPGEEKRGVLVWDSEDGEERWVYPQAFQGGSVTIARRKGTDKATLPVEFRLEKPATGGAPFEAYYKAARDGESGATPAA